MALRSSASIVASHASASKPSDPPVPKVVVIGEMGVGKTDWLTTAIHSKEQDSRSGPMLLDHITVPTIAFDLLPTTRRLVDNKTMRINFVDTAGQERFAVLVKSNYRDAAAFVLMYDVTDAGSFIAIKERWYPEAFSYYEDMRIKPIWFLIGTKTDLHSQRQVTFEEARDYAATIDAFLFETNTREGKGARARVTVDLIAATMHRNGVPCDSERAVAVYKNDRVSLRGSSTDARLKKSKCGC